MTSLYLFIFGKLWDLITLGIIGGLLYAFRKKIKNYIKKLLKEALAELMSEERQDLYSRYNKQ